MDRRNFLQAGLMSSISTAALWAQKKDDVMPTTPSPPFSEERSKLKITGVRMVRPRPRRPLPTYEPAPGSWSTGEVEVANPMSIYPEYKARRSLFMAPDLGPSAVEITTDKGVRGIGYGGPGAGFVIDKHLARLLIDEDPFNLGATLGHHVALDALLRPQGIGGARHQRGGQRPLGPRRQCPEDARVPTPGRRNQATHSGLLHR